MNECCLLKGFTAGPSEAFDGIKPINEEVISEGTLTYRVVWMKGNAVAIPSTGPGAAVGGAWALRRVGFSSCSVRAQCCGAWASLPCCERNLPGPGIEPVSPALAGGFFTTGAPGKSRRDPFSMCFTNYTYKYKLSL